MVGFEPWQLITSAFLHGNLPHIALNMYALYAFGSMVERAHGFAPVRLSVLRLGAHGEVSCSS